MPWQNCSTLVWSMSATIGSMATVELICRSFSAAAIALGNPAAASSSSNSDLPLQVAEFDEIAIHDADRADAGPDQRIGRQRCPGAPQPQTSARPWPRRRCPASPSGG